MHCDKIIVGRGRTPQLLLQFTLDSRFKFTVCLGKVLPGEIAKVYRLFLGMRCIRNPGSKGIFSSCATMKFQMAALLLIGLALTFTMPAEANVVSKMQSADISLHRRTLLSKDGLTEFPSYAKKFGKSARSSSRKSGLGLPDYPNDLDYVTRFSLGTPPREFLGWLDTGSDVNWVQCDPCKDCVPQVALFETNRSTSYESLTCSSELCSYVNTTTGPTNCTSSGKCAYSFTYGSGEATGELSSDVLTLADMGQNDTFPNFVFGCTNQDGGFGIFPIVALSRANTSLVSQLAPIVGTAFSFCLSSINDNKTTEFTLGSRGAEDLMYTPFVPTDHTLYYVNLTGISVNGAAISLPAGAFSVQPDGTGGMVLDTGSTVTSLPVEVYDSLRAGVGSAITYPTGDGSSFDIQGFDFCYNVTEFSVTSLDNLTLPTITFHFQDMDLNLLPPNTFVYDTSDSDNVITIDNVCLAMHATSSGVPNVFGNIQMANHYYFFDPDNGRVGIKPKQC